MTEPFKCTTCKKVYTVEPNGRVSLHMGNREVEFCSIKCFNERNKRTEFEYNLFVQTCQKNVEVLLANLLAYPDRNSAEIVCNGGFDESSWLLSLNKIETEAV